MAPRGEAGLVIGDDQQYLLAVPVGMDRTCEGGDLGACWLEIVDP